MAKDESEVYIDYLDRLSASKLAPDRFDRILGITGTTPNWNTLLKLIDATA